LPDSLYCIDSSALIAGYNEAYPPAVFPSLWKEIERLAESGTLICPDEVLLELERGTDELKDWARSQKSLFYPMDEEVQKIISKQIFADHADWFDQNRTTPWADPVVIALALLKNGTVVSEETWSSSPSKV